MASTTKSRRACFMLVSDGCLSCHREGGLAGKKQVGEHTHPVGRDMKRLGEAVNLPGYTAEGVKSQGDSQGRVTCASCHDPHQWDARDPEKTSKPGDPSDGGSKFLRMPYDSQATLCLTCHKNKAGVANTKHDLAVMAPDARNIQGRTPAEAEVCASCHLPHNGRGARMWAREPLAGTDPVSSVCLSCHRPLNEVRKRLHHNDVEGAIKACAAQRGSAANVIRAGLERYMQVRSEGATKEKIVAETQAAIQEANGLEVPLLERNLIALSTIASIATMIGLLGTVIGMIRSFAALGQTGSVDAAKLAVGISEALVINTAGGLFCAIAGIVAYNVFVTRVDNFNYMMDEASYEAVQLLAASSTDKR